MRNESNTDKNTSSSQKSLHDKNDNINKKKITNLKEISSSQINKYEYIKIIPWIMFN